MSKNLNYVSAIAFLFQYMKKYISNFIRFYLGWLFDTLLSIVMPILFGIMIDQIVYKQNVPLFLKLSGMYVILSVFSCLLYFFIYAQHHYLMYMFTLNIKLDIFRHILACKAEYLTDISSGDLHTVLEKDSGECMHFMIRNVIHQINRILSILITLIYLYKMNVWIGAFAMIAAPLSVFINTKYGKKIKTYGTKERESYGAYVSWVFEMLSAFKDIKLLSAGQHVASQFETHHHEIYQVERQSGLAAYKAEKFTEAVALTIRLAIFALAGYFAAREQLSIGVFTIVVSFYDSLTNSISAVSTSYLDGQHCISLIQKIYDFLHSPTENAGQDKQALSVQAGTIDFQNICFSYENRTPVLSDVTLNINAGEKIAVTGESGSGKTTLAYLLLGFYEAQGGEIRIDGQALSECSLRSIRGQIGLIAQDVFTFPGTIRENIKIGNLKATDEEINRVCELAGLSEVIRELPSGLDTRIGDGNDLSGGQKQRIAIARIYLRNPKIIIFDEATSALDAETEQSIHNAWKKVLAGRTAIIITHRESTLSYCDRVLFLEKGKLCNPK